MPTSAPVHRARSTTGAVHRTRQAIVYDQHRGSSHQRGYGATWQKLRMIVLRRDAGICQVCGKPVGKSGHVDHIVPKSLGGENTEQNLQTLCHDCHTRKTKREQRRDLGDSKSCHSGSVGGG